MIAALIATTIAGCAPEMARLRQSISHPGPAAYQRAEAIQHDPYLLDDVGPEVVGARPREYQRPLNEVERARLAATSPVGMPAAATPGVTIVPGPITGPANSTLPPANSSYPAATPYPVVPAPQTTPFQYQQRAPY